MIQGEGPHSAPGEMKHREPNGLQSTLSGPWMVVWSSRGSRPRRRTDRRCLQREGGRGSSQALRGSARVWRGEVNRRMPWNWTKNDDMEGQNGGTMFEVGAKMHSGGYNDSSQPLALFSCGRALSYNIGFPSHLSCGVSCSLCAVVVPASPALPPLILILSRAFCSCTS